jgi:hypothetical protein
LFSFRFCAVHPKDVRDSQLRQLFEVPLILYRDDRGWIEGFVAKNQRYRIEPVTQKLSTGTGDLLVSTQRIRARG